MASSDVQIRKLRVGFGIFFCLYVLAYVFPKCSETFLTIVTPSAFPLLRQISSSRWRSLPRSVLESLLAFRLVSDPAVALSPSLWAPSPVPALPSRASCSGGRVLHAVLSDGRRRVGNVDSETAKLAFKFYLILDHLSGHM